MPSCSWTGEPILLILKKQNKTLKKGKQGNKKVRRLHIYYLTFALVLVYILVVVVVIIIVLLELFMCIIHFGIPAIFIKRSYRITYLNNVGVFDQQLTVAPFFCITLSVPSLSTSSGILPSSPESPT